MGEAVRVSQPVVFSAVELGAVMLGVGPLAVMGRGKRSRERSVGGLRRRTGASIDGIVVALRDNSPPNGPVQALEVAGFAKDEMPGWYCYYFFVLE